MTLTDRVSRAEESPWEENEDILQAFCRTDEDLLLTIKLRPAVNVEEYKFEVYRGESPTPNDRFRVETHGNVVKLTLQHASRGDAGHYALVAKKQPNNNESERLFSRQVYMAIDESSFAEVGEPPYFLRRLIDLTVKVGTRTRFLVEIRSATDPKVTWHKNDKSIQVGPRFSFVHEGSFYCIDVAPVTVEDQGHWTCMAENRSGRSSCTSHLNVLVPKAYKKPQFVNELCALLTETGTVSLECKVVGVPTPVLKWFKDDKEIKAGDVFALTANPDDPTSLGTYMCEAVNCMGTTYSSSRVHVVGKGSREGSLKPADTFIVNGDLPIFKKILRDDSCKIGESILLSCQVQVPPWPKEISWYNRDGCVKVNDRYKMIEDGLGSYSIRVNPVEAVDEGEWKCVATSADNVKQFTTCFITMSIPKNYRKPRFMESLKAVLTEEGLVSFECKVVGFPTPLLRWFKDGQELKPGDVYQLTGTNSLGSYCCIAKNCMGEAKSTAELTVEDIQSQLNEKERLQLLSTNQPPKFIKGLRSGEAKISENFKFSVQVSIMPEPSLAWYRNDHRINKEERYRVEKETLGICHLEIQKLEFCDQAEWKCIASNEFGHSVTSCFLKLIIPKHYKMPKFLENLRAILSDSGAVNLECKVIGVPQPILKWYKDGEELKPGDIHRIISGQDGTCYLGTYTCEAINCMGTVSSSASLLGFEDRVASAQGFDATSSIFAQTEYERELARNLSLSTIHEERTSQLLDTAPTDHSVTLDDRGEVSFSFDGKEVSVSLYETPDLTEDEALQVVEMYADELSEHITEHNIVELPPMRFVKETSTSGNLLMEAVVIDVSSDYFVSADEGDDLRTEADFEDMSIIDGVSFSSPLNESIDVDNIPIRPPRRKSRTVSSMIQEQQKSESYHSAKEPLITLNKKNDDLDIEMDIDSEAFVDALTSACIKSESIVTPTKNEKELKKRTIQEDFSLEISDTSLNYCLGQSSGTIHKYKNRENKPNKKQKLEEKGSSKESFVSEKDKVLCKNLLKSEVVMYDKEEQHYLKIHKDKLLGMLRNISKSVLIVREALINSKFYIEDDFLIHEFINDNIVKPIQNICELITDIETQALKLAGDRSLVQNVRISILESIGGPTEELLRGLELIGRQENQNNVQINLSILESLVDPVDEIIFGLAKLEYELSGRNITKTPIVLERTIRIANRLNSTLQEVNNEKGTSMSAALHKIHKILNSYLNSIILNQFGGWTENIDAVLVESLARPFEDLEHLSKYISPGKFVKNIPEVMMKMSVTFNDILSRLDALVVALEGYECDYRTNFVINLKTSLVAAAEELSKSEDERVDDLDNIHDNVQSNLPRMILDSLIDVQTAVSNILHETDRCSKKDETKILLRSKVVLNLTELKKVLLYAVHKITTLKEEEIMKALINLKEPLIDLHLSLSIEQLPQEILIITNIVSPLDSLQKVFCTVIQHIEKSEFRSEFSNLIEPICTIIEVLKQQILLLTKNAKQEISNKKTVITENIDLDTNYSLQQITNNLQIASELSTVHFELATIVERYQEIYENIDSSIFSKISELRQSIGDTAVEIDKIFINIEPSSKMCIEKLSNLKHPLLNLQNTFANSNNKIEEQRLIIKLFEPLQNLNTILKTFSQKVIHVEDISSVINLIDDIQKDITFYINMNSTKIIEDDINIKSKSYPCIQSENKNLHENNKHKFLQNQTVDENMSIKPAKTTPIIEIPNYDIISEFDRISNMAIPKEVNQDHKKLSISTELLFTESTEISVASSNQMHKKLHKTRDTDVIYPKEEFALIISQSLEEIQQQLSDILEEFEQEFVRSSHPVTRLAEALENLRRKILLVRCNFSKITPEIASANSETSRAESNESTERISLSLKELLQPILEIREALSQTKDHRAPDLLLLNRLNQLVRAIECNVLQLALESHRVESDQTSSQLSLNIMTRVLEDIKSQIPSALDQLNLRQKALSILKNVSQSLKVIKDRIHEISFDKLMEDYFELDVANALNDPIDKFEVALNELFYKMDTIQYHYDKNRDAPLLLQFLIEPLVELQSSLSVVRSSRKISVVEGDLFDERKNVILRALEEVRFGIDKICNEINKKEKMTSLKEEIISLVNELDLGMIIAHNQISKANYVHRRSCLGILHEKFILPLRQLGDKIILIEEKLNEATLQYILEPLETLSKQVQSAQILLEEFDQPLDEEVIIEGFLYPINRLLSALESMKQTENFAISSNDISLLEEFKDYISNFGSALLTLRYELIHEGVNEKASIIETLTAVLIPLNNIKDIINAITEKIYMQKESIDKDKNDIFINENTKSKEEKHSTKITEIGNEFPTILTTIDTFVDEFIEVSKRETESVTTLKFATIEMIEENELLDLTHELISRNATKTRALNLEKYDEIMPLQNLLESSIANSDNSYRIINKELDNSIVTALESASNFVTEKRDSITVLWSSIKEHLDNLQQSISLIIESNLLIDKTNEKEVGNSQDYIIMEHLIELQKSIIVMQQIANEDSEPITITSWQDSIPALKNLVLSLEEFGEHLPVAAGDSILTQHNIVDTPASTSLVNALITLITPLHKLKECLGCITEEKIPYENNLIEIRTEKGEELSNNGVKISKTVHELDNLVDKKIIAQNTLSKAINHNIQITLPEEHIPIDHYILTQEIVIDKSDKEKKTSFALVEQQQETIPKQYFNEGQVILPHQCQENLVQIEQSFFNGNTKKIKDTVLIINEAAEASLLEDKLLEVFDEEITVDDLIEDPVIDLQNLLLEQQKKSQLTNKIICNEEKLKKLIDESTSLELVQKQLLIHEQNSLNDVVVEEIEDTDHKINNMKSNLLECERKDSINNFDELKNLPAINIGVESINIDQYTQQDKGSNTKLVDRNSVVIFEHTTEQQQSFENVIMSNVENLSLFELNKIQEIITEPDVKLKLIIEEDCQMESISSDIQIANIQNKSYKENVGIKKKIPEENIQELKDLNYIIDEKNEVFIICDVQNQTLIENTITSSTEISPHSKLAIQSEILATENIIKQRDNLNDSDFSDNLKSVTLQNENVCISNICFLVPTEEIVSFENIKELKDTDVIKEMEEYTQEDLTSEDKCRDNDSISGYRTKTSILSTGSKEDKDISTEDLINQNIIGITNKLQHKEGVLLDEIKTYSIVPMNELEKIIELESTEESRKLQKQTKLGCQSLYDQITLDNTLTKEEKLEKYGYLTEENKCGDTENTLRLEQDKSITKVLVEASPGTKLDVSKGQNRSEQQEKQELNSTERNIVQLQIVENIQNNEEEKQAIIESLKIKDKVHKNVTQTLLQIATSENVQESKSISEMEICEQKEDEKKYLLESMNEAENKEEVIEHIKHEDKLDEFKEIKSFNTAEYTKILAKTNKLEKVHNECIKLVDISNVNEISHKQNIEIKLKEEEKFCTEEEKINKLNELVIDFKMKDIEKYEEQIQVIKNLKDLNKSQILQAEYNLNLKRIDQLNVSLKENNTEKCNKNNNTNDEVNIENLEKVEGIKKNDQSISLEVYQMEKGKTLLISIKEPLKNLQQTLSFIFESCTLENTMNKSNIIIKFLYDLEESIVNIQSISNDIENITPKSWQNNNLPMLKTFTFLLEELIKYVNILAEKNITSKDNIVDSIELSDRINISNILSPLKIPLYDLRERLALIIEQQTCLDYDTKCSNSENAEYINLECTKACNSVNNNMIKEENYMLTLDQEHKLYDEFNNFIIYKTLATSRKENENDEGKDKNYLNLETNFETGRNEIELRKYINKEEVLEKGDVDLRQYKEVENTNQRNHIYESKDLVKLTIDLKENLIQEKLHIQDRDRELGEEKVENNLKNIQEKNKEYTVIKNSEEEDMAKDETKMLSTEETKSSTKIERQKVKESNVYKQESENLKILKVKQKQLEEDKLKTKEIEKYNTYETENLIIQKKEGEKDLELIKQDIELAIQEEVLPKKIEFIIENTLEMGKLKEETQFPDLNEDTRLVLGSESCREQVEEEQIDKMQVCNAKNTFINYSKDEEERKRLVGDRKFKTEECDKYEIEICNIDETKFKSIDNEESISQQKEAKKLKQEKENPKKLSEVDIFHNVMKNIEKIENERLKVKTQQLSKEEDEEKLKNEEKTDCTKESQSYIKHMEEQNNLEKIKILKAYMEKGELTMSMKLETEVADKEIIVPKEMIKQKQNNERQQLVINEFKKKIEDLEKSCDRSISEKRDNQNEQAEVEKFTSEKHNKKMHVNEQIRTKKQKLKVKDVAIKSQDKKIKQEDERKIKEEEGIEKQVEVKDFSKETEQKRKQTITYKTKEKTDKIKEVEAETLKTKKEDEIKLEAETEKQEQMKLKANRPKIEKEEKMKQTESEKMKKVKEDKIEIEVEKKEVLKLEVISLKELEVIKQKELEKLKTEKEKQIKLETEQKRLEKEKEIKQMEAEKFKKEKEEQVKLEAKKKVMEKEEENKQVETQKLKNKKEEQIKLEIQKKRMEKDEETKKAELEKSKSVKEEQIKLEVEKMRIEKEEKMKQVDSKNWKKNNEEQLIHDYEKKKIGEDEETKLAKSKKLKTEMEEQVKLEANRQRIKKEEEMKRAESEKLKKEKKVKKKHDAEKKGIDKEEERKQVRAEKLKNDKEVQKTIKVEKKGMQNIKDTKQVVFEKFKALKEKHIKLETEKKRIEQKKVIKQVEAETLEKKVAKQIKQDFDNKNLQDKFGKNQVIIDELVKIKEDFKKLPSEEEKINMKTTLQNLKEETEFHENQNNQLNIEGLLEEKGIQNIRNLAEEQRKLMFDEVLKFNNVSEQCNFKIIIGGDSLEEKKKLKNDNVDLNVKVINDVQENHQKYLELIRPEGLLENEVDEDQSIHKTVRMHSNNYIPTSDQYCISEKRASNNQRPIISLASLYNKHKFMQNNSASHFSYKKNLGSLLSEFKSNLVSTSNWLYSKDNTKLLSILREDLMHCNYDIRSSNPSLFVGTNILDLTSKDKRFNNLRKKKYSTSLLNFQTESKNKMHTKWLENTRKKLEHPTHTSTLFHSNNYSMSVTDCLTLSRSRRRFELRNPTTIYEGDSGSKFSARNKFLDRGKCPLFCTKLTNCTVAEGSHIRLICTTNGQPEPQVYWMKNGDRVRSGGRERTKYENGMATLEITGAALEDSGYYTCLAKNPYGQSLTESTVRVYPIYEASSSLGLSFTSIKNEYENRNIRTKKEISFDNRSHNTGKEIEKLPEISTSLADYKVPAGSTIALQVKIIDSSKPNVTWFRDQGERKAPILSPKIHTITESGVYTLIMPEATESEAGTYVCRVSNDYGHVDTSTTIEVIPLNKFDDLGKPAAFVSQPTQKVVHAVDGEAVSVSFRISGIPRPRVVWMKGIKDISDGPRSYKEMIDDYVRLTLNRVNSEDEGTYCILVKNCYGCDRSFFTLKVRQRARSLTPTAESLSLSNRLSDIHMREQQSYLRNVPGPISSEPIVVDGGRNWLSLSWGKADQCGPAPVIAYRVDAWQIGGDGGARWIELGISPLNSFDAFNLRPGGEYKFRVTPKNRYGWGESVIMNSSVSVCNDVKIPEFTKILPGQHKALEGSTVELKCEVRSDSKFNVKWLRDTTEIESDVNSKYVIKNERSQCSLVLNNINEYDSGRYICEVTNKAGKVSSYGRILVVNDPKVLSADARLKKSFLDGLTEDGPPQFIMRLRDRRVQTSYPVRLTCQVFGYPEPVITWLKDGKVLTESLSRSIHSDESHFHTLEIVRASLEDSGSYTACAKNANGSVSCRCVLVVDKGIRAYVAPQILYELDVAHAVKVGGDLRLTTQIEAYPSVGIAWHRDGIKLRQRRIATMTLSHDGIAELFLAKVRNRDAGVYTCTATNEIGKAETSTKVSVIGPDDSINVVDDDSLLHVIINPPDVDIPYSKVPLFVTKPLSTEAQEGDSVIIKCEVVGDPKPEVIWLRDFMKPDYYRDSTQFRCIGAGPRYYLEIPHAKLDYTGTYSVLAKNEYGEAKVVISLQIYAKGQERSDNMDQMRIKQGKVVSVPSIKTELKDIRCCDGDAITLECKVYAPSEAPIIRWEKSGKPLSMDGDFSAEFDGEIARLTIHHVYPEDEGEYTCVAINELGKAFTSSCLVVDVPEGKENVVSQLLLTKPQSLLSANSTPRSTPRSTPVRSLSPGVLRGRELKAINLPRRIDSSFNFRRKSKICPPKFYSIPHNRVAEEGETVRFQCAVAGHPIPWCTWDKDCVNVISSSRISLKEKDDIRILEIAEVTLEDTGLYRVTLENDFGRTEATARLEIINRNTLISRPIRTRSASPRTYPSISRSLLSTPTRLNGRLQLQCDIRGFPSPSTTWYRNGTKLERSSRVKKSYVGKRAVLEISGVKYSDAGEYVCEAKNLLGSTRSCCKVVVLDIDDPSTKDRDGPKFLQPIPCNSIVIEGYSYELQARLSGTPPFTVFWLKDGHEIVDSDYYQHIVYEDGGVALRFLNVHPLDAGDYTCTIRNEYGEVSCRGLFIVQDYKSASSNSMLSFVKTPVPVYAVRGETACFCTRIQSDRSVDIDWKINEKSAREDYRCKIERDGSTSILRISSVTQRDCGEIRCIASITRGPSISSHTQLRLKPSSLYKQRDNTLKCLEPRSRNLPRLKDSSARNSNRLSTPNLYVDKNSVDLKKRVSRFTRLASKMRGSSAESVCERCTKNLANGQLRLKSTEKILKEERTTRKNLSHEKKQTKKSVAKKLDSMLIDVVEIKIEDIEKIHPNIEVLKRGVISTDTLFDVNEIDKTIVEILVTENIVTPIKRNEFDERISEMKDNKFLKLVPFIKEASKRRLCIKRISSFKNSRYNSTLDMVDCDVETHKNYNNNNGNEQHSDKKIMISADRKLPHLPRIKIHEAHYDRMMSLLKQQKEILVNIKEVPALVLRPPDDVNTLRGSTIVLEVTYQGHPDPSVKWLRAGRELVIEERTEIVIAAGLSQLRLIGITADQAGKYAVVVENSLGSDCRFASVAVEGPPEPSYDPPSVTPLRLESGEYGANVTWCSPAYDGGCALSGYTLECRRIEEYFWRIVAENCHSLRHEATGLHTGATYLFRVRALNVHGPSEPSPVSRPFKVPFLDMDYAEDKLKVEEDEANMEDANKIVTPEEGHFFKELYELYEELGKGRYGLVKRVVEKKSAKSFAAKFVRTVKSSDRQQVHEEMKIMNLLRHPKLLRLTAAFESPKEIVMVTEYISGGELFERVVADDFTLTEKDSILFMRQICEGVRYMHENNVVHLDLKPENIMCHTRTSHRIKLIDFGLAQILTPNKPVRVLFGTPEFIPPEIINYEPIGTESDMWSVGVICYVLLTGLSPFMGDNDAETFANIVRADYDFEDEAFDAISSDAKDFISNLLQKKKELRMSAKQCISHSWLAQHTENMSSVALPTDKLKKFIVRRKWQPIRMRTQG